MNNNNLKHTKSHKKKVKRIDWSKVKFIDLLPFIIGVLIIIGLLTGSGIVISKVISSDKDKPVASNTISESEQFVTQSTNSTIAATTEQATEETKSSNESTAATEARSEVKANVTQAETNASTEARTEPIIKTTSESIEETTTVEVTIVVPTEATTVAPTVSLPHTIAFLGDSITCGYYSDLVYTDVVCDALDANNLNYGISGSTIASNNGEGFVDRYTRIYSGANLIVVYGGSNDYYNHVSLGSSDSTDKNTFYGALSILCSGLKSTYPDAKIVFLTPLPGEFAGKYNSGNNDAGYSIYDYVNAIKITCAKYDCYVFNSFADTEITNNNFEDYTVDGLHLNEKGHKVLGNALLKYIKKLYS